MLVLLKVSSIDLNNSQLENFYVSTVSKLYFMQVFSPRNQIVSWPDICENRFGNFIFGYVALREPILFLQMFLRYLPAKLRGCINLPLT